MENKGTGMKIVNLSNYSAPEVKEVTSKKYITFGKNNEYFKYLFDSYQSSPTASACISSISDLIYGKGLTSKFASFRPEEFARAMSVFSEDDLRKAIIDLKATGQAAFQVIYAGNHKSISSAYHLPIQTLAPNKVLNEDNEIQSYFYHADWSKKKSDSELQEFSAFGMSKDGIEILYIRNYTPGYFWFSKADWASAITWSDVEGEIANYQVNLVKRSFSPTVLISFNNGRPPSEEEENTIVRDVQEKFTGTNNTGNAIITWNDSKDTAPTIEVIPLSKAADQYTYVSEEAKRQILLSNKIVSPLLLGISSTNGFGSNKDEMITASMLMETTVINPFRKIMLQQAIEPVLQYNDINIALYFDSLNPFVTDESTDATNDVQMSAEELTDFNDDEGHELLNSLVGEEMSDEWELVDRRLHREGNEPIEDWANRLIKRNTQLAVIKSYPNKESFLDKDIYKVRYSYEDVAIAERKKDSKGNVNKSRPFCIDMMGRTSRGVVYRKEDIDQASFQGVNGEFAHSGGRYSLWKYKGGKYCHHGFVENLYRLKTKTDGTPYKDKALSSSQEVSSIPGYNPNPADKILSETAPIDTPTKGAFK